MSIVLPLEPRIQNVEVTDEMIAVTLEDGWCVSVPLAWSWRLSEATPEQRGNFQIIGDGLRIRWPDLDEDISPQAMLTGIPAPRPTGK